MSMDDVRVRIPQVLEHANPRAGFDYTAGALVAGKGDIDDANMTVLVRGTCSTRTCLSPSSYTTRARTRAHARTRTHTRAHTQIGQHAWRFLCCLLVLQYVCSPVVVVLCGDPVTIGQAAEKRCAANPECIGFTYNGGENGKVTPLPPPTPHLATTRICSRTVGHAHRPL